MSALASYIRHLIVTGLLLLVARYEFPSAGAEEAANALALLAIGTVTWALVKYAPAFAKRIGLLLLVVFFPMGCANVPQVPVQVCALTPAGPVCYSSATGISATVDLRSGK